MIRIRSPLSDMSSNKLTGLIK